MAIYMKIDGIDGDVTAKGHEKWIHLDSFNFTVNRAIQAQPGRIADRESSRPSISEVHITKKVDQSFPLLFSEACVGKAKPTVTIHVCQTDNDLKQYMEVTLNNAIVSHYNMNCDSAAGTHKNVEHVSLSFDKLEVRYTPYDSKNQAKSPISGGYDLGAAVAA